MNNKQNPSSTLASLDRPIKATADDAVLAKLATTQAGYYKDPFLENFARRSTGGISSGGPTAMPGERRVIQPIIKRGTHARVCVMDRALSAFCKANTDGSQIVVLGAGKDTSYFRLCNGNIAGLEDNVECQKKKIRWYEVDHFSVIHEKAAMIRQSQQLSYFCPNLKETRHGYETTASDHSSIHDLSSSFHLVNHDLRDSPNLLLGKLSLDPSLPTLFLTECVFMYMPNEASQLLLQALSSCVEHVYMACYEPILGDRNARDPFGQMMEQNLIKAGVASPGSCLLKTRTLLEQLHKLTNSGFARAVGCDMWSAYETILTVEQRKTANQSEFLDEYEEWILIMQHYCFVVATSDPTSPFAAVQNVNDKASKPSLVGFVSNKCNELNKP
ncbi:leucine carboxyl methyltransferase [Nitzschia inconspicua]|uniref:Leucine carboxyl methyltransferase 1 n=1 Tax=Nitzschia inconspicua TaxID=303405 RepID=A0A9K3LR34_9STRA|nr:leucine carboxyl methyltransferase [Nitzschia inconspicua]